MNVEKKGEPQKGYRYSLGGEQPKLHLKFAPPLSQEMRLHLAKLRDEAFAEGKEAGRVETEREYYGNGLISLGLGGFVGAGVLALIQRIFA
jgi:hypothetical protein